MQVEIKDMPKLKSPFVREMVDDKYQCIPKIDPDYKWVWSEDCLATDKIDGTNVSVYILNGRVKTIMNRTNVIDIWKSDKRFYDGVRNAMDRGYFVPEQFEEKQIFGELIGQKIQGNPYKLEEHLWLPFSLLKEKYYFKFWKDVVEECKDKSDKEIFEVTQNVFKELWSIYKRQRGIKGEVDENSVFLNSPAAEGIVFYNAKTGGMCKLRRDMFGFYKGRVH